jgi:4-amino-4-deoxy-L-arabinose transferase-like glycosyltransferase
VAHRPTSSQTAPAERGERVTSVWGGPWTALAGILGLAAALRLVGLRYGLPFPVLNPDEQNIVPRAWRMVHGGGPDPEWFDYPSLLLYLLAPFQTWSEEPSYLSARLAAVVLGLAGVAAAWWLGSRAYGRVAGGVAAAAVAVATLHVAYSRMAVTDVLLALGVTVALALLVDDRIELAGLAVGVATSAKYPGLILFVPLVAAAWGRWRRLAVGGALAVVGFLATSPYVAVHGGEALGDAWRLQRLAHRGWLGFEDDPWAGFAFVGRLWDAVGPALIVAAVGLVFALAAARRNRRDLVLASFVLAYFASLLTLDAHFDRYVLPLVPPLAVLAGRLRSLAPVTLLLLVVPLVWSIRDARELTRTDTRVVASRWIERNLPPDAVIAAEPSTLPLDRFRVVRLALPGPGRRFDENRSAARLREQGVGYVLVSGAVADRVLAARDRYPREAAFYDELDVEGDRAFFVEAGSKRSGPWVAVYHLRS